MLSGNRLTLLWQTNQTLDQNYSIFIHVLNSEGSLISQADGVPYDGLYPLPNWRPGQLISDVRSLDIGSQAVAVAIGLYDPATGQRLPAYDAGGQPLPEDRFILNVTP
jgi:hypothetical protein